MLFLALSLLGLGYIHVQSLPHMAPSLAYLSGD
jgi:hypothetical protein